MRPPRSLLVLVTAAALHAQGAVAGKVVTTSNGAPIHKATVLLRAARIISDQPIGGQKSPNSRDSYLTESDSAGKFSITGMVPGTYECVPSRTGFGAQPPDAMPSTKYYPIVTVEDGKTVSDVVLKLTPLGVITGRIFDADGDPVAHVQVMVMANSYAQGTKNKEQRGFAQTNDRGEYRVYNLFPGTYYLNALTGQGMGFGYGGPSLRGARPMVSANTYYPSTRSADQASPVALAPGSEVGPIDIHLQRTSVFSIRGAMPPEDPGHSYSFDIQPRGADRGQGYTQGWSVSQHPGQWEINGLSPGSYAVTLTRFEMTNNGRGMITRSPDSGPQTQLQAFVEVIDKDVDGVVLSPNIGVEVSGVVKSTGAKPEALANLHVNLAPEGGRMFSAQVKPDGTFTIPNILPDTYHIRVDPNPSIYATSIKLGSQELASPDLDLRHGSGGTLAIVVSNDFAEAAGKVTDADGNPDPSTNVTFVPDQKRSDWPSLFKNQVTDAEGKYVMRGLAPGTYTVFAWKDAPRNAPRDPDFRKPFENLGVTVTLEAGAHQKVDLKSIVTEK